MSTADHCCGMRRSDERDRETRLEPLRPNRVPTEAVMQRGAQGESQRVDGLVRARGPIDALAAALFARHAGRRTERWADARLHRREETNVLGQAEVLELDANVRGLQSARWSSMLTAVNKREPLFCGASKQPST